MSNNNNNTIPRQLFEAYWQGYEKSRISNGSGLDLDEIPAYVNTIKLAFSNLWPHNQVSPCFLMQYKHGWEYIKKGAAFLHQRNQRVLMSIIGTPDPPVGWNTMSNPTEFAYNAKRFVIDDLGLDGIDIDNEEEEDPAEGFFALIKALREALGEKGSAKSLLTYVSYKPHRDLPWLKEYGYVFDYVSLMAYWLHYDQMLDLFKQYADVLGADNVLIGVGNKSTNPGQETPLEEVKKLAAYPDKGGIMLWTLSAKDAMEYAETIHTYLPVPAVQNG
jgi:chitinase